MKKILFLGAFLLTMSMGYAQTAAKAPEGESKAHCAGGGSAKCCAHGAEKASCAPGSKASSSTGDAKSESAAPASSATADRRSGRARATTAK